MDRLFIRLALLALFSSPMAAMAVPTPVGLNPSDSYRFVFVTAGTIDATSADINTYNDFVQAEAVAAGLTDEAGNALNWSAIGSTATVDARDNTNTNPLTDGVGVPIFLLDGSLVANDNSDLWDGTIAFPIFLDQFLFGAQRIVWTGSNTAGTAISGSYLGMGGVSRAALSNTIDFQWVSAFDDGSNNERSLYGISDVINVPLPPPPPAEVPEPTTLTLLGMGLAGMGFGRRKKKV